MIKRKQGVQFTLEVLQISRRQLDSLQLFRGDVIATRKQCGETNNRKCPSAPKEGKLGELLIGRMREEVADRGTRGINGDKRDETPAGLEKLEEGVHFETCESDAVEGPEARPKELELGHNEAELMMTIGDKREDAREKLVNLLEVAVPVDSRQRKVMRVQQKGEGIWDRLHLTF